MGERITGHTLLIGLLATPIRHSLSPKMHNESFAKLGLDYAYLAFEVGNDALEGAVQGIRSLGIRGANVSMPNKQAIIPYLDELSPAAKLIGAVNTVTNKDGLGYLVGDVTDGTGAMQALRDEDVEVKGKVFTITGAGGAATAIAIQAALDGAKEFHLFNRNDALFSNVLETAGKINDHTQATAVVYDLADEESFKKAVQTSDIYVDATGVGMKPLENLSLINDPEYIHEDLVVFDVVYSPRETKLLKFAKEHGAKKTINGLGMMLHQGAESFKQFTGEEMPVDHVRELLFKEE